MKKIIVIVVLLAILIEFGSAYRILCPYPTISRSHFIVPEALFIGLAAEGHEVTVISAFPPDKPITNYRHIPLELVTNHDDFMGTILKNPGNMGVSFDLIQTLARVTIDETRGMMNNPQVKKIMEDESFDLVIVEFLGEPQIGLAAHFNCPFIAFSSVKPSSRFLEFLGNPLALSYVKHPIYPWADLGFFKDRLLNFTLYLLEQLVGVYFQKQYSAIHNELFPPPKYPPFNDVMNNNLAALFVTHHFSQGDVRPLVPGVIEISGIQMTEMASPLPDALQNWMDRSTNGVIYFSLGSNLKVSSLPSDKVEAIINVFKRVKQNILWKSDVASIPGLPNNVRLEKWVSQVDILQHNNTKLFITHGGFGSVTESKFYGVPVLLIPIFGDQIPNADLVVEEGWGVKLPYNEFNETRFAVSLTEVLDNPTYYSQAKYEAMLYRDRPLTALQTGIFWVEYIIRHKGARHMRSNATQLNWFQLHSVDVIGFLSAVLIIWAYVSYKLLKCLIKKLFGGTKSKLKIN